MIYDAANPLPGTSGTNARLELTGGGTAIVDLAVTSETLTANLAFDPQRIFIGKNGSAVGEVHGLELRGNGSTVHNEGTIRSNTSTAIVISGAGTNTITNLGFIEGAGLAIQGNAGHDRITNAGTLKTTSVAAGAVLLDLGAGDDFYEGVQGIATGGIIKLGLGNDRALGGARSEIFSGGEGNDYLSGGGGSDTVDYSEATGGISVDLSKMTSQAIGGGQGTDTHIDIENVVGGAHNDAIVGSTGNNSLQGGDGDDTLEGGLGSDTLDGGAGINTARYSSSVAARVDLTLTDAQNTSGDGFVTLIGIANLEGGSGADHFEGNDGSNRVIGQGGTDTLGSGPINLG
ncbi:calcium-binding protein [Microvirga roseola]|uniref:calcium-binding protein n=1 Tax=Microvirga roseola TaxID=2883126 RepID=UPI001E5DD295|nr:calcium-binding protein [Microvirga roseola]